jgi:hypothetical protein
MHPNTHGLGLGEQQQQLGRGQPAAPNAAYHGQTSGG